MSATEHDLEWHYAWLHEGDDALCCDPRACVFEFYYTGCPENPDDATVDELAHRGLLTPSQERTALGTQVALYAHSRRGERPLWEMPPSDETFHMEAL